MNCKSDNEQVVVEKQANKKLKASAYCAVEFEV